MKKLFVYMLAAAGVFASAAYADGYKPFYPVGGINSGTAVPQVYSDGSTGTLAQIGQMADGSVQQTDINAPNGVAGLDANGNVTNNVNSSQINLNSNLVPIIELKNKRNDPLLGSDTLLFGGLPLGQVPNSPVPYWGTSAPITLNSAPYGNYNNGCVLCIAMNPGRYLDGAGRAAITQADWRNGSSSVLTENAFVGLQEYVDNQQARLILPVAYYTATSIVLTTPLTSDQINLIRPGMYVAINSISPSMADDTSSIANGLIPNSRFYQSYTSESPVSPDKLTINVVGWAAPYSNDVSSGQQPHPTQSEYTSNTDISQYLDTEYSNYTHPVAFLGAGNKTFGRNLFVNFDYARQGSGAGKNDTTSLIRRVEGEEMDLNLSNLPGNNSVQVRGLTITTPNQSMCADGVDACGATSDSYALRINTELPTGIENRCGNDCVPYVGDSLWLHGNKGVQTEYTNEPVKQWEISEFSSYVDSTDNAKLVTWLSKDVTGILGINGASLHIAYHDGSNAGQSMSDWGSVVFNESGKNNGGASLCGGTNNTGTACGLNVNYNNIASAPNGIQIQNGNPIAMIPSNGDSSGHPYFYAIDASTIGFVTSAGSKASLSGNKLAISALSTDTANINAGGALAIQPADTSNGNPYMQATSGNNLSLLSSNGSPASFTSGSIVATAEIIIPFGTPASSTAECTQGQIEMDADYIYSCVATNTWHRTSNGATW